MRTAQSALADVTVPAPFAKYGIEAQSEAMLHIEIVGLL